MRTKIKRSLYEAAYDCARKVEAGRMRVTDARDYLAELGINRNSALDFVYIFRHMLRGEIYKRAMSAKATKDFIEWIRRDYGEEAFRKAITALRLHIPYNGGAMNGHRILLRKYEREVEPRGNAERVPLDTTGTIEIHWSDRESHGYTDLFQIDAFANEHSGRTIIHKVIGPKGGISFAKCRIEVRSKEALLDYESFRQFNLGQGMLLGVVRLTFVDSDRTVVQSVEWKAEGSDIFGLADFDPIKYRMVSIEDYEGPGKRARRVQTTVRERKGQAAFRRILKRAYGNTCCVSECKVCQVLEGAHIDQFEGPDSDHPQNGLLLRRDLHTLFDSDLMGINPQTRVVFFSKEAREFPEYMKMHGVRALRLPTEGGPSYFPSPEALRRRWQRFHDRNPTQVTR